MRVAPKLWTLGMIMVLASCVRPAAPEPAPAPAPAPPPAPVPEPAPAPPPVAWTDRAATPGDWTYRSDTGGSVALFGQPNAGAQFAIRCERAQRRIQIARPGVLDAGRTARMTLTATSGSRAYNLSNVAGEVPMVGASLAATDPFLDQIAYTRGRFLVQTDGAADMVLPAWAEVSRVVEDCRG